MKKPQNDPSIRSVNSLCTAHKKKPPRRCDNGWEMVISAQADRRLTKMTSFPGDSFICVATCTWRTCRSRLNKACWRRQYKARRRPAQPPHDWGTVPVLVGVTITTFRQSMPCRLIRWQPFIVASWNFLRSCSSGQDYVVYLSETCACSNSAVHKPLAGTAWFCNWTSAGEFGLSWRTRR